MDMTEYGFSCEDAFENIKASWTSWKNGAFGTNPVKWVVGISGGKDSMITAALACRIFGKDSVVGVSLPCDGQKDMPDVDRGFKTLGIRRITVDIGDAVRSVFDGIENNAVAVSRDTKINLPARLRMSVLYAVAQSVNGIVLCTANLTETRLGFATLYGDHAGSYSPLWDYTVSEVVELGRWLGLPRDLVEKTPMDGLQELSDEEKLGIRYADADMLIRKNQGDLDLRREVMKKFRANFFKEEIVNIPHPVSGLPDFVVSGHTAV